MILLVSIVLSLVIVRTDACTCMATHPSNSFCSAAVAVEVFVENYTEIYIEGGYGEFIGVPDNVIYNMTVKEVFRTNSKYSDLAVGKTLLMSAVAEGSLCGRRLSNNTRYFIAAETRYDGGLGFSLCSWTSPMSELTSVELDGVRGGYDCDCHITRYAGGVYGDNIPDEKICRVADTEYDWSCLHDHGQCVTNSNGACEWIVDASGDRCYSLDSFYRKRKVSSLMDFLKRQRSAQ